MGKHPEPTTAELSEVVRGFYEAGRGLGPGAQLPPMLNSAWLKARQMVGRLDGQLGPETPDETGQRDGRAEALDAALARAADRDEPEKTSEPLKCSGCGSAEFVCREGITQDWPMKKGGNVNGGVSIVFDTSNGAEVDYDCCNNQSVHCAGCGKEEPDVSIDFED